MTNENNNNKIEEGTTFMVVNDQGEQIECEVLFTFDSEETKNSYIVYTDDSVDETGSTRVFASIYDPSGADLSLKPVESDREWQVIESILSSVQDKFIQTDTDTENSENN